MVACKCDNIYLKYKKDKEREFWERLNENQVKEFLKWQTNDTEEKNT